MNAFTKRTLLGIALGMSGFSTLPAQVLTPEQMTIDDVMAYVKQQDIRSVEDLMKNLPAVIRQTFTLMENSRSRQRPSYAQRPRLIMFLPDGKFFMTVATQDRSRAYNDVEMLEFTKDKTWRLDLIRFPDAKNRGTNKAELAVRLTLPATEQCNSCHGPAERPIWGSYPDWPGAFADNGGQRLNDRQAHGLTAALTPSSGNHRLKLLDFRGKLTWEESETFNIPAYRDVQSPSLPNDAILSRHTEHILRRMEQNGNRKILTVAYLLLDDSSFLEATGEEYQPAVKAAKERFKIWVDDEFSRGQFDYTGSNYGDKCLLLFGLDTYDDLFIKSGLNDVNPEWEPRETDIDRNFSGGGDELKAFIQLLNANYLIEQYPQLEEKFERTAFPYIAEYKTHNKYRKALSEWLWHTSVDQRVAHLRQRRHLAEQLRFEYLFSNELQAAIVRDFLAICDDVLP